MGILENHLSAFKKEPIAILDPAIPLEQYTRIDLSVGNRLLADLDLTAPHICQEYIDVVLAENAAAVAYGGYLERRNLYTAYTNFQDDDTNPRNVHLGMDFWAKAGIKVMTPIDGSIHSFKNNTVRGDYGPTIVLKHQLAGLSFHTLYGHLSLESLQDLFLGKIFRKGAVLGTLGMTDINVNYAPHLHFQIIEDMGDFIGDYPGVSNNEMLPYYVKNCPDPNILLNL